MNPADSPDPRWARLWAPWRTEYITQTNRPSGCFLCLADPPGTLAEDRERLILARTPYTVFVLNRFPYLNGHVLVCPRAHRADLADLSDEVLLDLQHGLRAVSAVLRDCFRAEGVNIGLNLGRAAGAGVPGHLHWHVVPRWSGDHNFMAVTGGIGVISQSLEAAWEILSPALLARLAT